MSNLIKLQCTNCGARLEVDGREVEISGEGAKLITEKLTCNHCGQTYRRDSWLPNAPKIVINVGGNVTGNIIVAPGDLTVVERDSINVGPIVNSNVSIGASDKTVWVGCPHCGMTFAAKRGDLLEACDLKRVDGQRVYVYSGVGGDDLKDCPHCGTAFVQGDELWTM